MKQLSVIYIGVLILSVSFVSPTWAQTCPSDMVKAGPICVDTYEASVWSKPTGGIQFGATRQDYPCSANGNDCSVNVGGTANPNSIYARSVPWAVPSRFISWFQAQQACANVGKRLLTNAEWQMAAAGTPDTTACNVSSGGGANTGQFSGCVSNWGANDMVGNLWEWVADWVPLFTHCPGWGPFSDDFMCLAGASTTSGPGALLRGGGFFDGTRAGVFALLTANPSLPSHEGDDIGFRCGR